MYISDIKELDKIIRTVLISQSEVNGNFVRAALSQYGADLDKNIEDDVFNSVTVNDIIILFDNAINTAYPNMNETRGDNMYYSLYYTTHVIMYGNPSLTLVNKLIARLNSEDVRTILSNQGVYVKSVSNPTRLKEFKNGVAWMRNDFDIELACEMEIEPVMTTHDFDGYVSKNIITL